MRRTAVDFALDHPWALVAAGMLAALTVAILGAGSQPHSVRAAFSAAVSVSPGLDVQIDGVDVGKVKDVEYRDGQALVDLGISESAWPLRRGTTAAIRFGTTIGNGTRSVSLYPGPQDAPPLTDGGIIGVKRTTTPVEFDQVFDTLDARTRRRLRSMLGRTATALDGHAGALGAGLRHAAGGVQSTGDVVGDLLADETALTGLIANGDRVTRTLAARKPVISDLITVAAETFAAFGQRTASVRSSLDRLAPTLKDARATLARSDSSLEKVDVLFAALGPGARELPGLAKTAGSAVTRLERVAPIAVRTLVTARNAAPRITSLLDAGTPFMAPAGKALRTLAPMVDCVRPYAPEIAGMLGTWGGFSMNYDTTAHYARIHLREGATSINGVLPSSEAMTALPATDYRYAFPRPPGLNAGKPFFLPECGITEDALDPTKDPERPR